MYRCTFRASRATFQYQRKRGGGVSGPVIHHGTPMTPRAALLNVCAGRAMCVSFYRPDDVEVVEAISPAVMFRQRDLLFLASSLASRRGMGRTEGLDTVFRFSGASPVSSGAVGDHAGHAWRTFPAQRYASAVMALRTEGSASMAHGWADRAAVAAVRQVRPGMSGLDRSQGGIVRLSRPHGRSERRSRQSMARASYATWYCGGLRLPVCVSRQHLSGAEWMAL